MDASLSLRRLPALLLMALACGSGLAVAAEDVPLAIKGYDTVAYFGLKPGARPVPGKARHEYVWDEQRYRFASRKNMERFMADPGRYAPRFGNNCAGSLAFGLAGPMWQAIPENWLIHEDRLYIFGSVDSRIEFEKDRKRMISGAERNYERLRRGEPPMPEVPLPPEALAFAKMILVDLSRIIDNQPVSEQASLNQEATRP